MKFITSLLLCLISELVSVEARVLSTSLSHSISSDFGHDALHELVAREDIDYDEVARLYTQGIHIKRSDPSKPAQKPGTTSAVQSTKPAVASKSGPPQGMKAASTAQQGTNKGCLRVRSDGTLVRRMMCEGGSGEPSGVANTNPSGNDGHGGSAPHPTSILVTQRAKNQRQQRKNQAQQANNAAQKGHNEEQQAHNEEQKTGNAKQGKSNLDQQGRNEKQQDANVGQRVDNLEQKQHNKEQIASNAKQDEHNKSQQGHNERQTTSNTQQQNHNTMQERLNTHQQTANLRQDASNLAQKDSNTKQEQDNAAMRKTIKDSKPSKIDKCLDFLSGACTVAAGAVTLEGTRRMAVSPDDPSGIALAKAGGAATIAAGAFTIMKDPLKKCVGAACRLTTAGYNYFTGNRNQHQDQNQNQNQNQNQQQGNQAPVPGSPHTPGLNVRALLRRAVLRNDVVRRGFGAGEIKRRADAESNDFLAAALAKRRLLYTDGEGFDEFIWG